jgi:hypothetical protein
VTQHHPDPEVDYLIITGRTVKIREQAGVWSDPLPTFTQHCEAVECNNSIQVQMNKFTPEEVHNGRQEFAGRKAKPGNKMRFETNNGATIYCGDVHLRDKRF